MTEFTLRLKIPNAGSKEIYYSVHLTGTDSSHPEDYFSSRTDRGKANRLNLHQALENQSLRQVTDEQLDQIINKWNYGITNGKSNTTTVTISLEPYGGSSQPIAPVVQPLTPVKPPNYNTPPVVTDRKPSVGLTPKKPKPLISTPEGQRMNSSDSENPPADSEISPPSVETWATDNQADF